MKAIETFIMWNADDFETSDRGDAPPGSIAIGPIPTFTRGDDWTSIYRYASSGRGGVWSNCKGMGAAELEHAAMRDWYVLVYSYGIHPYVAHRAFLLIDEYVSVIKKLGCGPAKDEPGHDADVCYGRCVQTPIPEMRIMQTGPATHFWPPRTYPPQRRGAVDDPHTR